MAALLSRCAHVRYRFSRAEINDEELRVVDGLMDLNEGLAATTRLNRLDQAMEVLRT